MTGRISLVEQYENKDVIVQVKKCLDQSAEAVTVSQASAATATEAATNANAASARANAASEQAETASATVATYGSRLDAVEDQSAANKSSIQTIDGEITDIYNDLTNVIRKVGDPGQIVYNGLELRGTNRTPDTTIGQLNDLIVNGKRLIEELNAYLPMVRTTGEQSISGLKDFVNMGRFSNLPICHALGWTKLYRKKVNNTSETLMIKSGSSIIFAYVGTTTLRTFVISTSNRPFPQPFMKIAIGVDGEYYVFFNALYSSWAHVYFIDCSTTGAASRSYHDALEPLGARGEGEPVVGDVYQTVYDSEDFGFMR